MNRAVILIVEDDQAVRNLLITVLETHDFQHRAAKDGRSALIDISTSPPDIVILDLGLPDIDGVEIIRRVRRWSAVPIIILSSRSDDADKIEALDAGADDYLTKPFSVEELLARLRTTLRRTRQSVDIDGRPQSVYQNGKLQINFAAGCASVCGREIHLTPTEYKLLCLLSRHAGKVLTHNFIVKEVWGNLRPEEVPSLRVFVTSLRKKIEEPTGAKYIQTHIGIGYRMIQQNEEAELHKTDGGD